MKRNLGLCGYRGGSLLRLLAVVVAVVSFLGLYPLGVALAVPVVCSSLTDGGGGKTVEPRLCGADASADIVIMMDLTGSSSEENITEAKNAAKSLLTYFSLATIKPHVAIGTFNCPESTWNSCLLTCDNLAARIVPGGHLTDVYGTDGNPGTGLYAVINSVTGENQGAGKGGTNISEALNAAWGEMLSVYGSPLRPDHVILISDGDPNLPGFNIKVGCANDCGNCSCPEAETLAAGTAASAKAGGVEIFAIHYQGNGPGIGNVPCADEGVPPKPSGYYFMRDQIATDPAHFYEGNADLIGVFEDIAQAISCDDQNACTAEFCDITNNPPLCTYVPLTGDSDGDGVSDCEDQCPGFNDGLLGMPCTVGIGACANNACWECPGDPGVLTCPAIPGTPSTEVCNNIDDDCDGLVDEGLGSTTCGVGVCENTVQNCVAGVPQQCTPNSSSAEICDGLDNDCDGEIDEGLPPLTCGVGFCQNTVPSCVGGVVQQCVPGTPATEVCNGIDDDCDGQVDEGLGDITCGVGACSNSVPACVGGVTQECTPGTPGTETCNGVDDDCNGQVDEGLPPLTCGIGACSNSVPACVGGVTQECTPGTPSTEICDGIDNDCNGETDDGLGTISCGVGACANTVPACLGGVTQTCTPGTPAAETCNGIDDNCDGVIDNINGPLADTDGDGVTDCNDLCPFDSAKVEPLTCGCGVAETNTDGDAVADCLDLCPVDPAKTAPGVCGCGTSDVDANQNGTPDCQDQNIRECTEVKPTSEERTSSNEVLKKARVIRDRTKNFVSKALVCNRRSKTSYAKTASQIVADMASLLKGTYLTTVTQCTDSVCSEASTESVNRKLTNLNQKLYGQHKSSKLQAIRMCKTKKNVDDPLGKSTLDYRNDENTSIKKLPTQKLQCVTE